MSMIGVRIGLRQCPRRTTAAAWSISPRFTASRGLASISYTPSPSPRISPARIWLPVARTASRTASTAAASATLDWNAFFRLRTSRRRYSLASSIVSSIAVTGAAFVFLSTQPELADEITKLVPMDPVISMGIMTFAATLLGWLIGPVFGHTVWKLSHRSRLPAFTVKEKTFFERIKKHRVNPQGASANNPVPDYYGEKIGSVRGYRRWLKDQRAFNRKKEGAYPRAV